MAGSGTAHLRSGPALLRVEDLEVRYRVPGGVVQAVSSVSFDVLPGETLGVVGESGCGKSTVGRAILRLVPAAGGSMSFEGADLGALKGRALRRLRRRAQMIFQDPIGSLNPRRKAREIVAEGLVIAGRPRAEREAVAAETMVSVGLAPERFGPLRASQMSGGQAQRVAIARALAVRPDLLVCDEPVSALDVSIQAQIINLLEEMKRRYSLTYVFIAHDLAVVRSVSDRVLVMYMGKVCEAGDVEAIYRRPAHPYTRALLDSVPEPDPAAGFAGPALRGDIPSPLRPPTGCRFRTRCPRATERCAIEEPVVREVGAQQFAACHHPLTEPEAAS